MLTMVPVLKRGYWSADWALLPPDEFEERVRAIQAVLIERGLRAVVLCGDTDAYSAPCYVSGLPDGSTVVVPAHGEPTLIFSAWMWRELPFLKTLTWIRDIRVAGGAETYGGVLRAVLEEHAAIGGRVGTAGFPGAMEPGPSQAVAEGLAGLTTISLDSEIRRLRLTLRPREISVLRELCALAGEAADEAARVHEAGGTNCDAYLAAERTVRMSGVRDLRLLANLYTEELEPFVGVSKTRHEQLSLVVAVERHGYWGETVRRSPAAPNSSAESALEAMISTIAPAVSTGSVARAGLSRLPAECQEIALSFGLGSYIGLDDWPPIKPDGEALLVEGNALSLHVVTPSGVEGIVSATVLVGHAGAKRIDGGA